MSPIQSQQLREYNRLFKEMDDLYHELALRAGLSDSAFDILYTLCITGDGCLQKDICTFSFLSKQTINSSIRKLEREGLIRLTPGKGRDTHIVLTPAGKQVIQDKIIPVAQMEERAFGQIPPQQQQELLRLTQAYVSGFHDLVKARD
jgi:DNA-binding MarR family transcriptional regulator